MGKNNRVSNPNEDSTVDKNKSQSKSKSAELQHPRETETKPQRHIGAYFDEDVYRQVRMIAAKKGLPIRLVLAEALNTYFRLNDMPPIAK